MTLIIRKTETFKVFYRENTYACVYYFFNLYVYAFKHKFVPLLFSHTQEGTQADGLVHPKGML